MCSPSSWHVIHKIMSNKTLSRSEAHLQTLDFPEYKVDLLKVLKTHRGMIALPKESLEEKKKKKMEPSVSLQTDNKPIYSPAYRTAHSQLGKVDELIIEMMKMDVLKKSNSPWNFPL